MTKVAMIGCGKLGLPCAEVMATKYDVVGYDVYKDPNAGIPMMDTIEEAVKDMDLIFIAVPTPHDPRYDGRFPIADLPPKDFDYSIVQQVLRDINPYVNQQQLVALISTVTPGTVREHLEPLLFNARFIYNPYLIAMGSVKWDMVNPECIIIGTEDGEETGDAKLLIDFYKPLMENNPRVNVFTWDEAEAFKVFYNTAISLKLVFVNMIQDVAEANENINVDVVTDALKAATQRITGPRYMTAGMGDAGACHPRDNIALRAMAERYHLGYDLFQAIMHSRDKQARKIAFRLVRLHDNTGLPIYIHGRAFKPYVSYTIGSYSELIGWYIGSEYGVPFLYIDPLTNDDIQPKEPGIFLMAHNGKVTYEGTGVKASIRDLYCDIPKGSIVLDPWRTFPETEGVQVIHYGNPRKKY